MLGRSNSYKGETMTNASFDDEHLPPEPPPEEEPAPRRRYQQEEPKRYGEFRQPPADREAEQGVLGAMLLSPHTVMEVIEELEPEDFYYPAHTLIYRAMLDLYSEGKDVDAVILASQLDRFNNLERVGGAPYLHTLLATVPTAANARYSAESRRMTISEADISSEKITEDLPCCKEQERIKSMARVDLPTPGRAATMTIWPA